MKHLVSLSIITLFSISTFAAANTPKCFPENPGSCSTGEEMRALSDYKPGATDPGCCYVETAKNGYLVDAKFEEADTTSTAIPGTGSQTEDKQ